MNNNIPTKPGFYTFYVTAVGREGYEVVCRNAHGSFFFCGIEEHFTSDEILTIGFFVLPIENLVEKYNLRIRRLD